MPLELPNFNLKVKKAFFFSYLFTKLWNNLPSQVRLSRDVSNFKSKLQDCGSLERVLWSSGHIFSYLTAIFLFRIKLFTFYVFIASFYIFTEFF